MTDTHTTPYSGDTFDEFRTRITRHAYAAQQRYGTLIDKAIENHRDTDGKPLTDDEHREMRFTHHACFYGWSVVSLIGFIRNSWGDEAAQQAADLVDDIGTNGDAPFTDDLPYPPIQDEGVA